MPAEEIWGGRWKVTTRAGSGGQGSAHVVEDQTGVVTTPMVLKRLNNQRDAERRRRMHREVAALQSLNL